MCIINLSNYKLSNQEREQLKLGLDYSFVDKTKDVRRFLATHMESLADSIKGNIDHKNLQHFYELLRGYTDIFTNKIYTTKDYTYHNLRGMIQNKDIVVVKGDRDSSVDIIQESDYVTKLDTMINDSTMKGPYVENTDNTLNELFRFQDFLYRNFHNYKHYKDTKPDSNQPAHLYGTAKTHKFETLEDSNVANLKFRPITDQTEKFAYNAAKVTSDYLRPLCKNEYCINDTQKFPSMLSSIPPLYDDEEDTSDDVESLFTNIPIEETINYVIEQIYAHKKLTPICLKLISRRLLIKLATECTFKLNSRFFKQMNTCTMFKIENDAVTPSKPLFYRRFVDDIYSKWKLVYNVLFGQLNNYHPSIELIIEVNPSKSLDTKLININGAYKLNVYQKNSKPPSPWTSKTPKRYKQNRINGDLQRSKRTSSNFNKEIPLIKEEFMKADYPLDFINSIVNEFQKGKECGD